MYFSTIYKSIYIFQKGYILAQLWYHTLQAVLLSLHIAFVTLRAQCDVFLTFVPHLLFTDNYKPLFLLT